MKRELMYAAHDQVHSCGIKYGGLYEIDSKLVCVIEIIGAGVRVIQVNIGIVQLFSLKEFKCAKPVRIRTVICL